MGMPNLKIQMEPVEAGKLVYLPLAATTATGPTLIKGCGPIADGE